MIVYHRTSPKAAKTIRESGRFVTRENTGEIYVSDTLNGEARGYGDDVVTLTIPDHWAELDDEFPTGERHYRIAAHLITARNIVREETPGVRTYHDKPWRLPRLR